ncbi:MAG TPA: hypothetical protein IAA51_12695 [Candidatus Cottocaccamicrobium excrementipullorum]|nr:hypothetical protein [Candidatus Cottocaccamicrobium excrementipullorum]
MWRKWTGDKRGHTLAEIVVSLALGLMISAAAAFFLSRGIRFYRQIQAASDVVCAADMVLAQITAQIKKAGPDSAARIRNKEGSCQILVLSGPYQQVKIQCADDGRGLYMESGEWGESRREWQLDPVIYQKVLICGLNFSLLEENDDQETAIQVQVEMEHEETGFTYQAFRCVRP